MIKLENCPVCKETKWKKLDYLRDQKYWYDRDMREKSEPVGFKICKECGFLTYDYVKNERLAQFYERQRPAFNPMNIITCNRKNRYHEHFLNRILFNNMSILDVGCAQGSFLNHINELTDTYLLQGTEYSTAYRRFGIHEYNLDITREIQTEYAPFDLISYYHVLEHIQYPREELEEIRELLADDGYLYISVPDYLDRLEEKGGSVCENFEDYYHLNHVNCFTFQSFKNLLNVVGFEIVKEDTFLYGYTVLCKKCDPKPIVKENYQEKVSILEIQKKAIDLLKQKKPEEAIKLYPKFPDAYLYYSLNKENMKLFDEQERILKEGLVACPDCFKLMSQLGKVYFQWDENKPGEKFYSNNIKRAEEIFTDLYERKPGSEESMYFLAHIEANYKGNFNKAVEYLKEFLEINPTKFQETYSLIANFWNRKGDLA